VTGFPMGLRQAIKDHARDLGFDWVGITGPEPAPHYPVFENWLNAGHHGEMGYLGSDRSRLRRADPRRILPECQSILALGVRYPAPELPGEKKDETRHGKVASYAWGMDYHDILPARLRELVAFIETQVGSPVPNRWYTDTGPILERDIAQRAGLGWIGKNTCLIHPKMGSYFLLAEILLGVELQPDPPFTPDHCGTCTRCLDACPTACILPDRTIDSRRCISYLTIELKGPIPRDLRPLIGEWVFGCDICQQVCPWNKRFALSQGDPVFGPRLNLHHPDLTEELALTAEEFNRKFKGSPVKRSKRRGYLRNIAVALGNSKDPSAAPALRETLLNDPEPLVRGHAAWALGNLGGDSAVQALKDAAVVENDSTVLGEIQAASLNCVGGNPGSVLMRRLINNFRN